MVWYHLGLIMQPLVGSCHQLNQSQSSIFYIPTPSILCYLTFDQRTVSFDRWLQTGIYADRCKHPLGRRRPFIILGSLSLLQTHYTDGIIIDQIHLDSIYPLIRLGQVWRPFYRFWSLSGHVRLSTWCSRASLIWYATLFLFFFPPQLFFYISHHCDWPVTLIINGSPYTSLTPNLNFEARKLQYLVGCFSLLCDVSFDLFNLSSINLQKKKKGGRGGFLRILRLSNPMSSTRLPSCLGSSSKGFLAQRRHRRCSMPGGGYFTLRSTSSW